METHPQTLGDFEIIRELGRGGMGVVYEAKQKSLNRRVALKVLSQGPGLTTRAVTRFKREAEAAARLQHTNIVPIYSTGEENRLPYYAMELIDGPSLDQVIRQMREGSSAALPRGFTDTTEVGPPAPEEPPAWVAETIGFTAHATDSPTESASNKASITSDSSPGGGDYFDNVARMLAEVAGALEHAHEHGVIHRDIKPSNLLLAPDGRLSVNDFGLARVLEQPGMTISGEFVGSPLYMSPEQITAGRLPLDHRTDIYSLGATLYEFLTLKPPFSGQQRDQIFSQIIHKEPVPPRTINKRIPLDLQTICLKAMEKDPDRRYQTAANLADDLRCYVNGLAISARRTGPVGHLIRWAQRHRALSGALSAVMVLLMIAGSFGYQAHLSNRRLQEERLDRAVNEAIILAMSGDQTAAERKIREADGLGAEPWMTRMLTGQVKLFSDRPEDAVEDLKHALSLKPDSIAVQAMLGMAYFDMRPVAGEAYTSLEASLTQATPVTTRDKLFLGSFLSVSDPHRGIALLQEAKAEADSRESNLAMFLLAFSLSGLGLETVDVETAEQAVEAAGVARRLMPELVRTWLVEYQAQRVAAEVMRMADRERDAERLLAQAEETLQKVKEFPDSLIVANALEMEARSSGDPGVRLEAWRRAISIRREFGNQDASALHSYALELYLAGRQAEAEQILRSVRELDLSFVPTIVLAESAGGVQAAYEEISQHQDTASSGYPELLSTTSFLLLGKANEARHRCQEIDASAIDSYRSGWGRRLLAYCRGDATADELLASVDDQGRSQMNRCEGHFFVGMMLFSDGRRLQADEHFEKCLESGVFFFYEYEFARAILTKRKEDPDWPPWIPAMDR